MQFSLYSMHISRMWCFFCSRPFDCVFYCCSLLKLNKYTSQIFARCPFLFFNWIKFNLQSIKFSPLDCLSIYSVYMHTVELTLHSNNIFGQWADVWCVCVWLCKYIDFRVIASVQHISSSTSSLLMLLFFSSFFHSIKVNCRDSTCAWRMHTLLAGYNAWYK